MPVVLLCHFDGTNGSTAFTDVSPSAHTLTRVGVPVVSTANPKFGSGAGSFAGAGDAINTNNAADFNLGSGQFTLEAWAYFTAAPAHSPILAQWGDFPSQTNLGWFLGFGGAGTLGVYYSPTGSTANSVTYSFTPTLNTWYHIAADRDAGNTLRLYVNGVVVGSAAAAGTIFASTTNCIIGSDGTSGGSLVGQLDEARITTGLAQYGGAFTPPTGPFGGAVATVQARAMVLA